MSQLFERLHVMLALLAIWLFITADQVHLANRIHVNAGFWDYNHIVLGSITALLSLCFLYKCCRLGQWRLYFGWCIGQISPIVNDLRQLKNKQLPAAGAPGLLTFIEGFGLILMVLVGLSGCGWLMSQGGSMAMTLRDCHIDLAGALFWYLIVHAIASFSHFLEMLR
ncbi:cytochrome b561 [Ferrimonas sediminum]|uniref:Cytochrome b561 n=2 Tax=Ferrimonas sediminum TaxID=718193 RepID=A0A1G8S0G1_9GAMM|nr:cytochrome b561 [Ferrimonas sediminum]